MAQLIFGHDEALAQWAAERFPDFREMQRPLVSIGFVCGGELTAAAIYNHYSGHDIRLSVAATSPRWARRGSIRAILAYPFRDLHVKRVTSITSKGNKAARRLLEGVGFKLEGVHPLAADGVRTAISYGLRHDSPRLERWFS